MYQTGVTIKDALDRITSNEYVLPAIQREFVWDQDQICALFDSIMQGYPFGEFLFWRIAPENSAQYRYYGFVLDYHERDNPHCPDLGQLPNQQMIAVLDGQQRLTAFNIGLRGSMAVRPYRAWRSSPYPRRVLALDLLKIPDLDEEGNRYNFQFVDIGRIGREGDHLWFKVADIMTMQSGPDMFDWLLDKDLDSSQQSLAFRTLDRLYRVVHTEPTITYYEESNQDIEHVLNIFARRNRGGTPLSYSDLLLSIAVSQWTNLDARKEVHELFDEMNKVRDGLSFSKNFILKAGLMLSDISSVGFRVENFTRDNMAVLEKNWLQIRTALLNTAELVGVGFKFDSRIIRADSSLLPIAYYIYQRYPNGMPSGFTTRDSYSGERKAIWGWLTRCILKDTGIWSYSVDALLTVLRDVIRNAPGDQFPAEEIRQAMAQRGKSLEFSQEDVENLADMRISDRRIFPLLALLSPFIDTRINYFHIDHVFPIARFAPTRLRAACVGDELHEAFADRANCIANLQLLDGDVNLEKRAKLPKEWMHEHFANDQGCQHYRDLYLLGEVPLEMTGFMKFYETRRERLQQHIAELVNSV